MVPSNANMKDVPKLHREEASVRGGVCFRHGMKAKTCRYEGCTNNAKKGGVCIRHGATVKRYSHERYTNQAVTKGVCMRHGVKLKGCSH